MKLMLELTMTNILVVSISRYPTFTQSLSGLNKFGLIHSHKLITNVGVLKTKNRAVTTTTMVDVLRCHNREELRAERTVSWALKVLTIKVFRITMIDSGNNKFVTKYMVE